MVQPPLTPSRWRQIQSEIFNRPYIAPGDAAPKASQSSQSSQSSQPSQNSQNSQNSQAPAQAAEPAEKVEYRLVNTINGPRMVPMADDRGRMVPVKPCSKDSSQPSDINPKNKENYDKPSDNLSDILLSNLNSRNPVGSHRDVDAGSARNSENRGADARGVAPSVGGPDAGRCPLPKPCADGLFVGASATEWMQQSAQTPDPVPLFGSLWFENEIACLFADTNVGKSILAVQMADHISRQGRKVVYMDFEMTAKLFQMRYSEGDRLHDFSPLLRRYEFAVGVVPEDVQTICGGIAAVCAREQARILIIDNITWLCNRCEEGDAAGLLMQALVKLKKEEGLSVLVLAHTPKRPAGSPISINDLAGSKRLANFMDSIFSIGVDASEGPGGRYVKQLKVRSASLDYGESNVIRYVLDKQDTMVRFTRNGFGRERDLLPHADGSAPDASLTASVELLYRAGTSLRKIAETTGASFYKVRRIVATLPAPEPQEAQPAEPAEASQEAQASQSSQNSQNSQSSQSSQNSQPSRDAQSQPVLPGLEPSAPSIVN